MPALSRHTDSTVDPVCLGRSDTGTAVPSQVLHNLFRTELMSQEDRFERFVQESLKNRCSSEIDKVRRISTTQPPSSCPSEAIVHLPKLLGAHVSQEVADAESVLAGELATSDPAVTRLSSVHRGSTLSGASRRTSVDSMDCKLVRNRILEDVNHHWSRMLRKEPKGSRSERSVRLPIQESAQRLKDGFAYELFVLLLVVSNAVFIGLSVQYLATYHDYPDSLFIGEIAFALVFTGELAFRVAADWQDFLVGDQRCWNIFDSSVVVTTLIELALRIATEPSSSGVSRFSILRLLRTLLIIRVVRIIRVMKFFRELRLMILSILGSFKSFVWVVLLQSALLYVFGVCLTQGATGHLAAVNFQSSSESILLRRYFGTVDRSILSLFQATSGGISWGELVNALRPIHGIYTLVFLLFISFALFAMVNIVTGIFLESALRVSQADRDVRIQEEIFEKEEYLGRIQQLFDELDVDSSGTIGMEEFRAAIQSERIVATFNALDLDITDVSGLFKLLDRDVSGEIDVEEFMVGCLRLRGEAKSIDLARLMYDCNHTLSHIERALQTLTLKCLSENEERARRNTSSAYV
eukprot:TRINITY_DN13739_c0_g1_i2.p1 TRINITY_DN13739_c0_g1~~TRINITY_DN13739_c0_g1_i2.p1  ORF type:complete len:597 (-),score=61.80 TRINITY_DN13739_c0_g1_i2:253-1995(-)